MTIDPSNYQNIKVSVIIPTYKRIDYLGRAIESVLVQTHKNIEIVIVDDNKPTSEYRENTAKFMDNYKNNPKIIYIKNSENLGGALARNQGIINSTGDYITFLDDDDVYLPDKISDQLEYMIKNNLELSFSNVDIRNESGKLIDHREHKYIKSHRNTDLLKYHLMYHLTPTGTYMYKRDALMKIGGFDDAKVGQEFRLMLKSIEKDLNIGYLNKTNVIQYAHAGERISIGPNKIKGETELFILKQNYFGRLSISEQRFVRFRYYAVQSVVGFRSRMVKVAITNLVKSFFVSPIDFIIEGNKLIKTRLS